MISVLLPCRDAEQWLDEALASLAAQTLRDFEVIAIDDGSTDRTPEILAAWRDRLDMQIVSWRTPRHLPAALNAALRLARGRYIARQDADDISLPQRFEVQANLLDANPEIDGCGAWFRSLQNGVVGVVDNRFPEEPDDVRRLLGELTTVPHPTYFMRREVYETVGGYSPLPWHRHMEDLEWLTRATAAFRLTNVQEVLVHYRIHDRMVCRAHQAEQALRVNELHEREGIRRGAALTIILPLWRTGAEVRACLKNLASIKLGTAAELVIVDDGSPHDELSLILDILTPLRFNTVWIPKIRNGGISAAWNSALRVSRAPLILWLGADDRLAPDGPAALVQHLQANPSLDLVYGDTWFDDRVAGSTTMLQRGPFNAATLSRRNFICNPAFVYRRALHDRYGTYREDLAVCQDWEFWLRCVVGGARFEHIDRVVGTTCSRSDSAFWEHQAEHDLEAATLCRQYAHLRGGRA